ncbi:carbonic anhydrase [Psychromonas antarctica]|uniref:carbonic anhydrase n=1 Tax=Psychromonas antarctica TaxID=67573 RepID=UPI001EE9079F|nr:carbonic anhydrase [Psychromonas antarctica]MCG6201384.1 carbonic anhydrase [Psychromonas antarctica]
MAATDKLIAGYQRFREGYYQQNKEQLLKLAEQGQSPKIAIVCCSDSRVDPAIILDCDQGDLFVIRNVANLVPPCESSDSFHGTSAALEFAVNELQVESIIVLGHTQCGGIKSLMDREPQALPETFISKWMKQLENVRHEILANQQGVDKEQQYNLCEQQGITQSLANLMTFPCIQKRVAVGSLRLHGWYYDLNSAELFAMQADSDLFQKIS